MASHKPTGCSLTSQRMKPVLQVLYQQLSMEVIIVSRAARGSLRRPTNTKRRSLAEIQEPLATKVTLPWRHAIIT